MCRSRREISNEYLLAKIGVVTTENEPLEVWGKSIQYYSFVSLAAMRSAGRRANFGGQIPVSDNEARPAALEQAEQSSVPRTDQEL